MSRSLERGVTLIGTALVGALVVALPSAPAGTKTDRPDGSFNVTVVIHAACSVIATDMVFGAAAGSHSDGTSTVTVTCDMGIPYNIGLGIGTFAGASAAIHAIPGPASGLTLSNPDMVPVTANGGPQTITVRGRMPAAQPGSPGNNADVIAVTVSY
jgi:spore coat protein U-like protein